MRLDAEAWERKKEIRYWVSPAGNEVVLEERAGAAAKSNGPSVGTRWQVVCDPELSQDLWVKSIMAAEALRPVAPTSLIVTCPSHECSFRLCSRCFLN